MTCLLSMWMDYWMLGCMSFRSSEIQDLESWLRGCYVYQQSIPPWPYLILCVNGVHSVSLIQQFAGICDIDCCLLFISRQNPELDSSLPKCRDGIWNPFLESVFNPSGSWKHQTYGSTVRSNVWQLSSPTALHSC